MGLTSAGRSLQPCEKRLWLSLLICTMLLSRPSSASAGTFDLSGQFSAWGGIDISSPSETGWGIHYLPELSYTQDFSEKWKMSAEAALNLYGFETPGQRGSPFESNLYRLWVRLASPQFEMRAGLQKISFGPATLLRPLMWFDTLDPRDPLQLTRGVYGLLARYYFLNNANIWVWGLYGNDRIRGWQSLPSSDDEPEYGCRLQIPAGTGEMAFSYHHRTVDPGRAPFNPLFTGQDEFSEDAFGLDGKWDVGIGLWFEGTVTHRHLDISAPPYLRMLTVGMDYTFDVGNGLHVLAEHLILDESDEAFGSGTSTGLSALAVDYPLNLFDTLSAILYYDGESNDLSSFLQWQRTYDHWQVYLSLFSNPDRPSSLSEEGYAGLTGDGMRLMFVYNH